MTATHEHTFQNDLLPLPQDNYRIVGGVWSGPFYTVEHTLAGSKSMIG